MLQVLMASAIQSSLFRQIELLGQGAGGPRGQFAVFALTYEPERNALPGGLPIDFQGDAVVLARGLLPAEVALIVKEHSSQKSSALRGFLGRSPLLYQTLQALPNTYFVQTSKKLSETIQGAEAVFTLTGTVAVEAVLAGVPVAYFGSPWWRGLPGTISISQTESFKDVAALQLPSLEDVETFFQDLVSNTMVVGVAGEKPATVAARFGAIPEEFWAAEASALEACIRELMAGH
jgi:hypothetical protein